jgi:hypothetical protein
VPAPAAAALGGTLAKGAAVGRKLRAAQVAARILGARRFLLLLLAALMLPVLIAALIASIPIAIMHSIFGSGGVAGLPRAAIAFLPMYEDAAHAYGVNPFVLMAVHEDESRFSLTSAVGVANGFNFAGCCAGPMQFSIESGATPADGGSGGTWGSYRLAYRKADLERPAGYPGRFEPHPNVYDSYDSIYAAAAYLSALGARRRLDSRTLEALKGYTGDFRPPAPVAQADFDRAKELEQLAGGDGTFIGTSLAGLVTNSVPGARAKLLPNGLAAAPEKAPPAVKRMIAAANGISDKPYQLVHYPTHIDSPTYDCSSSTSHVLWAGGKFGVTSWCSQQFETYGEPDDPRKRHWVTVWAHGPCGSRGHVFLVIAGLRFDTSMNSDTGPNRSESGPRWRTLARPTSGFVPRHPLGL